MGNICPHENAFALPPTISQSQTFYNIEANKLSGQFRRLNYTFCIPRFYKSPDFPSGGRKTGHRVPQYHRIGFRSGSPMFSMRRSDMKAACSTYHRRGQASRTSRRFLMAVLTYGIFPYSTLSNKSAPKNVTVSGPLL